MRLKTRYLVLLVFMVACATEGTVVSATDVAQHPGEYDRKTLAIRGYLMMNQIHIPRFYLTKDDALRGTEDNTIDLSPVNDEIHDELMFGYPTCVIARGKFETYNHGKIVFGAFSATGILYIENFTRC